jgi:pimeloyl-ACP methyl ester carboxylesterase
MTRVLYLHGFASGVSSRKALLIEDRLKAAGAHVDILDLAEGDFEHLTLTGQLGVIERAASGEPVSLVGSSMGGYLAAAPAFALARRWAEFFGAARMEQWRSDGFTNVFHYGDGRERRLGYQLLDDAARYEDYPEVVQPTLIFHGAHDDVVLPESSQYFAANRPHVHLEILDSGHDLLNVLDYMAPQIEVFLLSPAIT